MHALDPSSHVTFPMITDICERVSARPTEAAAAVQALVEAFADRSAPPQRRFKALTILHEMIYDPLAAAELRAIPDILEVLQELKVMQDSGLGENADEQFRMFATELEAACYGNLIESTSPRHRKRDMAMELIAGLGSSAQARFETYAAGDKYVSTNRNQDLTRELFQDVSSSVQTNLSSLGAIITSKMPTGNAQTLSGVPTNVSSWGAAFSKNLARAYNVAAVAAEKGQKAVEAAMQDIQDPAHNNIVSNGLNFYQSEQPRPMPGCIIVPHPMDVLNPNEIEWE